LRDKTDASLYFSLVGAVISTVFLAVDRASGDDP